MKKKKSLVSEIKKLIFQLKRLGVIVLGYASSCPPVIYFGLDSGREIVILIRCFNNSSSSADSSCIRWVIKPSIDLEMIPIKFGKGHITSNEIIKSLGKFTEVLKKLEDIPPF